MSVQEYRLVNLRKVAWLVMWAAAVTPLLNLMPASNAATPPKINLQADPISSETKRATSFAPVVKKVAGSVVSIYTTKNIKTNQRSSPFFDDPTFRRFFGVPEEGNSGGPKVRREQGLGSGVIVTEDGYILTNNHVVEGADEIRVALASNKKEYEAKLIGTDPHTEIAVIKVEAQELPAIALTDSGKLEVGDTVLAVGNPFDVGQTVTLGIVSAVSRGMGLVDYEDFIQTDASINPGNSGGALVDAEGRLVGINTAIISRSGGSQGIGFAIPSNLARFVLDRIVTEGKVTRGYLGVMLQPLTLELAREFKLPNQSGALVGEVTAKSPAQEAGLKDGDAIVEFNGKNVTDNRQLRLMVSQTAPATQATLKVIREGKEKEFQVTVGELPSDEKLAGMRRSGRAPAQVDVLDGVEVADLDRETRRQLDIPPDVRGAVVMNVDPESPSYEAGIRQGDVVLEINRQPVADADEAVKLSNEIKGARALLRVWSKAGIRYMVVDASKKKEKK